MAEIRSEIHDLVDTMRRQFTPPSYWPGCEVKSVADKDEYTTDNGYIEAIVGEHNQQRVRYYGEPVDIQVGDFVDVEYFPGYSAYRVFGSTKGGTAVTGGIDTTRVSKVFEPDLSGTVMYGGNGGTAHFNGDISGSGDVILSGNTVPVIVDSVTKTVQSSGGDFTTIQDAVDWFKNKLVTGTCIIDVEAGSYDEAVVFEDIFIGKSGSLILRGDTRGLAGLSYVDGASGNQGGLTNGGSGTISLSNSGNDITVTGATTNPDFDADGWGNGDTVLVYDNTGTVAEYTISSVSNNVITLTATAPNVGNDATAILLKPNREIARSTAGECIRVNGTRLVTVDGFHLDTSTGSDCHGVQCVDGGYVICDNVSAEAEDEGFRADSTYSVIDATNGANSAWSCNRGFMATNAAQIRGLYVVAVGCSTGVQSQTFSLIRADNGIFVNNTTGVLEQLYAYVFCSNGTARQNTFGYRSLNFGCIHAASTNANNNGNGTDYSPGTSGTFGSNGTMIIWS